ADRPVLIALQVRTDLSVHLGPDRRSLAFKTGAGVEVLHYVDLQVIDAVGTILDADMELAPGRLVIRFHDENARYPVVVDPLLTAPSWTIESNQNGAQLGVSIATAGD